MHKRRLFAPVLLFALLLSACGNSAAEPAVEYGSVSVYRLTQTSTGAMSELFCVENVEAGGDEIQSAIDALGRAPEASEMKGAIPDGIELLEYTLEEGALTLEVSEEYRSLSGINKTIVDYAIALTLCSIDVVEYVNISVRGRTVTESLSADDVMLYDAEINPYEKQLKLYFINSSGRYLSAETHTLTVDGDTLLGRYVVEGLLRGTNSEESMSTIPEGTTLLSISSDGDTYTVDFSREFYDNRAQTVVGQRLTIYSVINSLTALTGVEQVLILVEGDAVLYYGGIPLSQAVKRDESVIESSAFGGGRQDVDIYIPLGETATITAVPAIITLETEGDSVFKRVLEIMLGGSEYGDYSAAFPETATEFSASVNAGVCTLDLPPVFYGYYYSNDELQFAVDILAATLTELDGIVSVTFTMRGGQVSLGNLSLNGYFTKNESIIVQ